MLQQTRIEAVLPYYRRFVDALPTIQALAEVQPEVLLKLWEGLGYYSRARNLQKAAQIVMRDYDGVLPADYDALLSLPGIGAYTAGAIASIAYGIPVPAVDGNVMRVLARLTADDTDVLSTEGKKRFTALAWDLVPEQDAGRFNQALMELGETICVPGGEPSCSVCPLQSRCQAYQEGSTARIPVRIQKTKRRIEERRVALVRLDSQPLAVLLHQRDGEGLLADLWEFPNTLGEDALDGLPTFVREQCRLVEDLPFCKHLFSHIEWRMNATLYTMEETCELPERYAFVSLQELRTAFPLASAFRKYADLLPQLLGEEC